MLMAQVVVSFVAAILLVLASAPGVAAQSNPTSSLSGVVVDTGGGVIPGATVVVTLEGTGTTFEVVTNSAGVFSVPALPAGVYSVRVSLEGFKTAVVSDVRLQPGIPGAVNVTLEVGRLEETVVVTGAASEIVNTQTATIAATLNVDQINRMPLPTRNALNAVTFLPGVNTPTTNRNSNVNGLPDSFINITTDGVSNNDNFLKSSDGFFASVTPRQDAVEAVTVTLAAGGAEVGGHGAVTINFVTRSGSNRFTGSAYEYFRHPALNTNYWFNIRDGLEKNDVRINQYGARQGGPIVIPGLYDGRGKAFFFVNYEELRMPNNFSRTRTILHPRALDGWFRYTVTVAGQQVVREVNVLDLARANGQLATTDPLVMRTLAAISASVQKTGVVNASSDPLLMNYAWLSPGNQTEKQPTIRLDYNLGKHHRLSGTYSQIWAVRDPDHLNGADRRFPDAPNYRKFVSTRPTRSIALRSTLGSSLVNELRVGITRGGASYFGQNASNGPQTFEDMAGFAIDFDQNIGLTNWFTTNAPSWRSAYQYTIDETLNWQKGRHSVSVGGGVFFGRAWEKAQQMVPGIQLGFDATNDPAALLFTTANFPGASSAQLADARDLYGLLTGRVVAVTGQAALDPATNRYVFLGARTRAGKMNVYSAFVQDSWRMTPTFTLNAGLRWDVQTPFTPSNDVMSTVTMADVCGVSGLGPGGLYTACKFFAPGASGGKVPEFQQFTKGRAGYKTDWNNVAPSVGVAWRPNVERGWLRALLGDPEQATIRAGYSVAYDRQGMSVFTGAFGANPGSTLSLTRDAGTGLVGPGESWPVLLRERNRLYPAPFPETPIFPIPIRPNRADSINAFRPDIKIASAHTWTVSLQRALSRDMAVEVRYVGTRGVDQWSTLDYNERNLIENGFFEEFKLAMLNLQANNAAGGSRAGSFAYFGPGTGTYPLPIYLAYLNGRTDATNPAAYTGGSQTWTSTTLASRLVRTNPAPGTSAADLDGNLTRRTNALRAGLPANFFVVNPDASSVNVTDSGAYSDYHALQIEVRRRLSKGLQVNGSYQYAIEGGSAFLGFHYGRVMNPTANVRHAIKTQWDWSIPVGRGRRFGSNLPALLNAVLGNWDFNGVGRIQARVLNFGNVRLVGMTAKDLQKMYKFYLRINPDTGLLTPYMLPEDVILNTRRAFSVSTTSLDGYSALGAPEGRYIAPANSESCIQLKAGDCAPRTLLIRAPFFTRFDMGLTKRFPIRGALNFEVKADVMNVFNNVNFNPVANPGSGATIFQVTTAYRDPSNTFDPGGRLGMISVRLNW
jgi:hypothetical protein